MLFLKGGEPKGFIFFNKDRKRVIYTTREADEDEIVELLSAEHNPIKTNENRKGPGAGVVSSQS